MGLCVWQAVAEMTDQIELANIAKYDQDGDVREVAIKN